MLCKVCDSALKSNPKKKCSRKASCHKGCETKCWQHVPNYKKGIGCPKKSPSKKSPSRRQRLSSPTFDSPRYDNNQTPKSKSRKQPKSESSTSSSVSPTYDYQTPESKSRKRPSSTSSSVSPTYDYFSDDSPKGSDSPILVLEKISRKVPLNEQFEEGGQALGHLSSLLFGNRTFVVPTEQSDGFVDQRFVLRI